MKLGLFTASLAAVAAATEIAEPMTPWYDGDMFGQVDADALDFNEVFDDVADFFIQVGSEDRDSLGNMLLQTKALTDDFIMDMQPVDRQRFDQAYAQVRQSALNWLSQINENDRARVGEMLSQTSYGQYFMQQGVREETADQINNFFSQLSWTSDQDDDENLAQVETSVGDEEIEEMAEFLAQLNEEEIQKLNALVEVKRENMGYNEDF
uniref:Uncharacterized protein n=1 Tax=Favella ehrenbergii TaxID=182087 RepID=A0A7S3HU70_9SPIT|mmetsp:Transcript_10641/g.13168  ORF Transcript_10641/g.13168 Transcript_10641/m.13168 type:complete len:209 (+) Transcript_10641:61-687(+)|eukprot:CAMPEP_0170460280 /NCGR_PEP_ID=MMETSP0123-20130129/6708_1 /TAXON_ID=182087 /ORGANISM="Favella ehrenbergii, Strain Fehren 1" /LENGTH=208 /DNA_ID=CAMNT_0010725187 /DNA_START=55 /DNA_END=681 /DNA_ORIENTATION=+